MQRPWWVGCALALVACGRIAQGTDDVGSSNDPLDCTYGKIASVPGLPLSVASTGKTIFVVSYDVGGGVGDLRAITSDGAVHLLLTDDVEIGMFATGSSLAFAQKKVDLQQNPLSETINVVDPSLAISQLDTTNANIGQLDSLTVDNQGGIYWQRWQKGNFPNDPSALGPGSLEKYAGGSTVTVSSSSYWASDLVTDGANYYGLAVPEQSSFLSAISRLAIGSTPELVLVGSDMSNQFDSIIGVDDTNVVYSSWGAVWAVAKNGTGAPIELAPNQAAESSPVLYDHYLYWSEQNGDGTSNVARVSTSGSGTAEIIATESGPVPALAVDACGVVYAATNSAGPGQTGATIYRSKL